MSLHAISSEISPAEKPKPQVHSLAAACSILGFSSVTAYKLRNKGLLKISKLLGKAVVTQAEIERFLAALEDGEIQ